MGTTERVGARAWHQALLGLSHRALSVERQAYRLAAGHSDELVVLRHGSEVCVAGRFGDVTRVWSCHDRDQADDLFDARMAESGGWIHVARTTTRGRAA